MINIQSAISQMRVARRLGKLSAEQQTRTLRRLGYAPVCARAQAFEAAINSPERKAAWALLAQIDAELAPVIQAKRQAELTCFDIKYEIAPGTRRATPKLAKVTGKVTKRELTGYEYTRAWWDEQEKKERAANKAAKKAGLVEEIA